MLTRKFFNEKWAWSVMKDAIKVTLTKKVMEREINERVAAVQAQMQQVAITDMPFNVVTTVRAADVPVPDDGMDELSEDDSS